MSNAAKADVMNNLLFSAGAKELPEVEELNALLYRTEGDEAPDSTVTTLHKGVLSTGCEALSVQLWEQRARIRIKVSRKVGEQLSIDQVAEAAVTAISQELEKVNQ